MERVSAIGAGVRLARVDSSGAVGASGATEVNGPSEI